MAITGFVLQGGGALGAFELGVIECLLDNGIKPDVVSGVSIGAINATVLCGSRHDDPRVGLNELWEDLTTPSVPLQPDVVNQSISLFGNSGMYQTTEMIRFVSELEKVMDRHDDLQRLKEHPGFKALKQFQAPIHIVEVTNDDVRGASDFSAAGIDERRRRRYAAAAEQIGKSQLAA